MVTHGNLAANAEAFMIARPRHATPSVDKGVSWLPLFHDMGLIGFVVGPLFTNIPCVFLPTASFVRAPRIWLDKIHEHRGTITYAPELRVRARRQAPEGQGRRGARPVVPAHRGLRRRAHPGPGAARLRRRASRPRGSIRARSCPSYGMAEATLAITFVPPAASGARQARERRGRRRARRSSSTAGAPSRATRSPSSTTAGTASASGRSGRSSRAARASRAGYFQEPELTAQTYKPLPGDDGEPWLHTGDLGYLVGGRLFVCGRVKDIIIVRGRNYYPSDIEWAVSELPGVRRGNVGRVRRGRRRRGAARRLLRGRGERRGGHPGGDGARASPRSSASPCTRSSWRRSRRCRARRAASPSGARPARCTWTARCRAHGPCR